MNPKSRIVISATAIVAIAAAIFIFWSPQDAPRKVRPSGITTTTDGKVQFITVEPNVELEVIDFGGSGRALILLAGYGGTAHSFADFASRLTPDYHVYAITRRGFGESSVPVSGYSADRLGDDVVAVLDALKLSRPVLVGHSMAGEELSDVATRHPEKVAGLIYLDAGGAYALYDEVNGSFPMNLSAVLRRVEVLVPARFLNKKLAIFAGQRKFTELHVTVLAIFADPHDLGEKFKNDPSGRAKAEALDIVRTERQVKAFELQVPSAKVVRLPHASHVIFKSNPTEVLREMNAFIRTLP